MLQTGLMFTNPTAGAYLSNMTDMRNGAPIVFTTPSVNLSFLGIALGTPMVAEFDILAATNRNPATPGVGAYSGINMWLRVQGNGGLVTTEALWFDVATLFSVGGTDITRPHIPAGSTGSGVPNVGPVYSNRAVARFVAAFTNYRLWGSYIGSYADLSYPVGALKLAAQNVQAERQ